MKGHPLLRGLFWIGSLVLVGYLLEQLQFGAVLDQAWIDNTVRGQGIRGESLFLGIGILFTALGLPRQMLSFFGGYAFGVSLGCLLALAATVAGCVVSFYYARWLGRGLVVRWFPTRLQKIDRFVGTHPLRMTLLIRLLPVGSNLATNVAAGVSSMRGLPFFTGSALGYLPQTLVFALIGSGIAVDPLWRIGSGTVLFLLSSLIGVSLYRHYRRELAQLEAGDDSDTDPPAGHVTTP